MRSPSLVLINDSHLFVSGEVEIHPTAAIASGVLLQADPGCRVVVGSGACIGSGSILHATQGDLVIEAGVILGSGVLIIGSSTIGETACIGSLTTILGCSVEPKQFIPAESLLGDRSRQVESSAPSTTTPTATPAKAPTGSLPNRNDDAVSPYPANPYVEIESPWSTPNGNLPQPTPQPPQPDPQPTVTSEAAAATSDRNGSQPESQPAQQVVYGRAYIEKMMIRMFPHRQALDSPPNSDSS
jgi:carbon dioxide concentrating mechanism protein CcmN